MRGWASFDDSGTYRYTLQRRWAAPGCGARCVCFCLLNPSTADARVLDPTLTRCLSFARAWGFGAMEVVNIFALRSTDPAGLRKTDDPVGPGNDRAIRRVVRRCDRVVVGWGNHGTHLRRSERVRSLLAECGVNATCWGVTKTGEPKHPLYLRRDAPLMPFALTSSPAQVG